MNNIENIMTELNDLLCLVNEIEYKMIREVKAKINQETDICHNRIKMNTTKLASIKRECIIKNDLNEREKQNECSFHLTLSY